MIKYCRECKYSELFTKDIDPCPSSKYELFCSNRKVIMFSAQALSSYERIGAHCGVSRSSSEVCGLEGSLWEAKR